MDRIAFKPTRERMVEFSKCLLISVLLNNESKLCVDGISECHGFQPN